LSEQKGFIYTVIFSEYSEKSKYWQRNIKNMNEKPQLRRKVTFKRRSNVIQLTTFFESLNQQYEQELKEQQEKNAPYPFDFEEEEVENEDPESNTDTESASEQQLNVSTDRIVPSKNDVYPGIYLFFFFTVF